MKTFAAVVLGLVVSLWGISANASSPNSWIDVVATYGADNTCVNDAGPAINNAIASVPAAGGVLFFQTGCYLIKTQVIDKNSTAVGLVYLGYGPVQFKSFSTSTPTASIIQFGDDTHTVELRRIEGIWFNCNDNLMDGIDLDGFANSRFDDVTITYCHSNANAPWNWHMRTVGNNGNNYANNFIGGLIVGDTANGNGINLGGNYGAANLWTFVGVKLEGLGAHNGTYGRIGLELEGVTGSFIGGNVSEWGNGICLGCNNPNSSGQVGSFLISGNYLENNSAAAIRAGNAGAGGSKAVGFTIEGNYINCNNNGQGGVDLEQAAGYTISGNFFNGCTVAAVRGMADGTNQGADNGFIGANFIASGQPMSLSGSNNMSSTQFSTKSSAYTLVATDTWVNVTGTTTITIPHALTGQRWDVFNSGSGNVTLVCDSGTINGSADISFGSQTGKSVTVDGTNCFAH